MALEIPLQPSIPNYTFYSDVRGVEFIFDVRWNATMGAWFIAVASADGAALLTNVRLRPGWFLGTRTRDARLAALGVLQLLDTDGRGDLPSFDNLGMRFKLLSVEPAEIAAALPDIVAPAQGNEDWGFVTDPVYNSEDWGAVSAGLTASDDWSV